MIYAVTAFSIDPTTGDATSSPRVEEIDNETNELFHGCSSPWEVEDVYLAFWNRLNQSWEYDFPANHDKVVVISVVAQ